MRRRLWPIIASGVFCGIVGFAGGVLASTGMRITQDQGVAFAGSVLGVIAAIFGAIGVYHYQERDKEASARNQIIERLDQLTKLGNAALAHSASSRNDYAEARTAMREMVDALEVTRSALSNLAETHPDLLAAARKFATIRTTATINLKDRGGLLSWGHEARIALEALLADIQATRDLVP